MNKSKINLPHIKLVIAHGLAVRMSQRKIAESLNVSQPTISRIARQADMLELIQKEGDQIMQATESMLAKIRTDPVFLNNYQKEIERYFFKDLKGAFGNANYERSTVMKNIVTIVILSLSLLSTPDSNLHMV